MLKKRLIARLDIRSPNLIKTRNLEGVRIVGSPQEYATKYNDEGIDEILFLDVVASLYGRNSLSGLVSRTVENVFCPVTVGGGIRTLSDARALFLSGADKIAVNTEATHRPEFITELAQKFGSQAVVLQLDAKRTNGCWEAWREGGREPTGFDAVQWAVGASGMGAGEILITSIDKEGMCVGYDVDLISEIASRVTIPVVASGGMGTLEHTIQAIEAGAEAVAAAHVLHYGVLGIKEIKASLQSHGIPVRNESH